jgi:putative membrane protein
MAANRTMMAWVRTGISLISFGFTIHKVLQTAVAAAAATSSRLSLLHQQGPRRLGLMLIFLGIMSILLGTYEYFKSAKQLNEMGGAEYTIKGDFSLVIGALVGLLGLFLFVTILTNTEVF